MPIEIFSEDAFASASEAAEIYSILTYQIGREHFNR
jgi:hypothetical protein